MESFLAKPALYDMVSSSNKFCTIRSGVLGHFEKKKNVRKYKKKKEKKTRKKMSKRTFGSVFGSLICDWTIVSSYFLSLVREVKSNWFGTSLVKRTRFRDSPRLCLII